MPFNTVRVKHLLQNFDFRKLFIDELGWNKASGAVPAALDGSAFQFNAVAEKCGLRVFECVIPTRQEFPNRPARMKLEKQLAKTAFEHLLLFTDEQKNRQVWQWVRRETGSPVRCREQTFTRGQSGELLAQKLQHLAVSLQEEEELTIVDVNQKTKQAFDVEKVTKRFYERFKKEHEQFLKFVKGIPGDTDRAWYASLMLNRLMFVYFIQKKHFLNDDENYLKNKLAEVKKKHGNDQFLSFYRHFLLRLFHEGLGQRKRSTELDKLLGKVPYLNGGLFDVHDLERDNPEIRINDKAFEKLFAFFDEYNWHLDERPLKDDKEINPDVLGYIFEKYINQKQMGAYYTKEDITGYIARNTLLPFLLSEARKHCTVAFQPESALWKLLRDDPDRYIFEAVRRGVTENPPLDIGPGLTDVSRRASWNRPTEPELGLPTETWREFAARWQRCNDLRAKLRAGQVHEINDLITWNLDIRQFAEDVIDDCEGPELLRALYQAIKGVSVLDPTCGSGAFLFAALNILETLYDACLERMQSFVAEADLLTGAGHPVVDRYTDFCAELQLVENHPNRRYFILKSIIVNNLYGVDIMDEAVEICKLRLFLKLVAQVEKVEKLEPLPDIDFNIRAGNTLVGFAVVDEVKKGFSGRLDFADEMEAILQDAAKADEAFEDFRRLQTQLGTDCRDFHEVKEGLRNRLDALRLQLDQVLAGLYDVDAKKAKTFRQWHESHRPFHWLTEFYGIMNKGGFDVVLGNPPYLEIREVDYSPLNFACADTNAIHAMCIERSLALLNAKGCMSMIVPLSLTSTQRMQVVQDMLERNRAAYYSNFSWRPGKLFDTVNRALTIFVITPSELQNVFSTGYQKWSSEDRGQLMERIRYVAVSRKRPACWVPKFQSLCESEMLSKCLGLRTRVQDYLGKTSHRVYYRTDGGLYWKVFTDFAPSFVVNGKPGHSTRETWITLEKADHVLPLIALLSSNTFWWWYTLTSNCRHLNPYDVHNFPIPSAALSDSKISSLGAAYLKDLRSNSTMLVRNQKQTGVTETQCFKIQLSKNLIDEIDCALGKHYGFTEEELDFIINYDIKYRMGGDDSAEDDA
jgi:hypothetical protein